MLVIIGKYMINLKSTNNTNNLNQLLNLLYNLGYTVNASKHKHQNRYDVTDRTESRNTSGMQTIELNNDDKDLCLVFSNDRQLTLSLYTSITGLPLVEVLNIKDYGYNIDITTSVLEQALRLAFNKQAQILESYSNIDSQFILDACINYRNTFSVTSQVTYLNFTGNYFGLKPAINALVNTLQCDYVKKSNARKVKNNAITQIRYLLKIGQYIASKKF